jgi:alanyl-tRNA synthetase
VSNTREIGPVTLLERSNPGEGLTRVEFAVGPDGIDRRATHHRALRDATGALGTNVAEVAEVAGSVRAERDALRDRVRELERAAVADAIGAFGTVEKAGARWRIGVLSDTDTNDAGEAAKDAVGDGGVIAAVGDGARPYLVVAAGPESDVHAGDVVDSVTDTFGGGGGGGPPFAQGGGLDADPEAVVEALREWEPGE